MEGDPGLGKSLVVADLAATVSTGGKMPDQAPLGILGNVLLISGEDAQSTVLRPRLEAHGADLDRVAFWPEGERLALPRDLELLRDVVEDGRLSWW